MFRKIILFVLRCRLEDVLAAGFSVTLLAFLPDQTDLPHLPIQRCMTSFSSCCRPACSGVKCSVGTACSPRKPATGKTSAPGNIVASLFKPLVQIFRDWFPVLSVERLLLCALHQPDAARQSAHGGRGCPGWMPPCSATRRPSCWNDGSIPGPRIFSTWFIFRMFFHFLGSPLFLPDQGETDFPPRDDGLSHLDAAGHRQLSVRARHRAGKFF